MITSYGLDLSGYKACKTALAKAIFDPDEGIFVTVFRSHTFSKKFEGKDLIGTQLEEEKVLIKALNPLFVDVPIDLQELNKPNNIIFTWELTKRPVDFALSALPPLADRIGTPVARMQKLLLGESEILGKQLFETYPKASLGYILGIVPSYKKQTAEFTDGSWIGEGALANILRRLRVQSVEGTVINDDHLDAIICSLTGILKKDCLLEGEQLEKEVRMRIEDKVLKKDRTKIVTHLPKGYVIIKNLNEFPIQIKLEDKFELKTTF